MHDDLVIDHGRIVTPETIFPGRIAIVTHSTLHGISDYSLYKGFAMRGWPAITIVKGRVVFRKGQLIDTVRNGTFLRRGKVDFSSLFE